MVWDYNDRTPTLRPAGAARLRFIPPQVLGSCKIPYVVWGNDASICHEVPLFLLEYMEILVPEAYLGQAAACLVKHLPIFSRKELTSGKPQGNDQSSNQDKNQISSLPHYSDKCILLASRKHLRTTADFILLIPDSTFYFDATDPDLVQEPPDCFELPPEFKKTVRVPKFPALMEGYLKCLDKSKPQFFSKFREYNLSYATLSITASVAMLVAWRRREPVERIYDSPDEYPATLRAIRDCLSPQCAALFDGIFTTMKD
ncbi:hypothetical protein TWF506_006647 [Arthrobotrys conoides]|uniref:Uncharacterized protein n=1 Tax=Arthrobotrys conoides TaxID=74498 RepID=A0AAN8NRN3_9PEZI